MIRGYFEPRHGLPGIEPWPMVAAFVYLPRLNLSRWVRFLVDIGADVTCVNLRDAVRLIPDFSALTANSPLSGVGQGTSTYASEASSLIFLDTDGRPVLEDLPALLIATPDCPPNLPSLLGRDILARYTLELNIRDRQLRLL